MDGNTHLLRAVALSLAVTRDLADRGLSAIDPEVTRELSERGVEMVPDQARDETPPDEPPPPDPPTPEPPVQANGNGDAYVSMKTQLSVAGILAGSDDADAAIYEVLATTGDAFGWREAVYWAPDEEDAALRCRAYWHSDEAHAQKAERRLRSLQLGPGDLPTAEDGVAVPVSSGDDALGMLEFAGSEGDDRDPELTRTLGAVCGQLSQFLGRKRAEAEVEELKDEFFGLVSHELRTPLTSIVGYTEMLSKIDGEKLSDRGRNFIDVIRRNARREMRLVGDLLVLVRIQAGTFEIEPGTVNLLEVVEESIETARPSAEQAKLTLTAETEPVKPCAGDAERLAQAVDNLLSNAVKFTPEGGHVSVRLKSEGDHAVIQVSDTGIGIPEADHARLFDRLYRASSATEGHVPGTGLGLTIVKAIVEAHGGTVSVESREHHGATFTIELPLRALGGPENGAGAIAGNGIPSTSAEEAAQR